MSCHQYHILPRPAPVRIQRKRTKGWKMPDNTIYVGRPTIYGNPFPATSNLSFQGSVALFQSYIDKKPILREQIKFELRGKNLACWCPADMPCHADVLLKIANED